MPRRARAILALTRFLFRSAHAPERLDADHGHDLAVPFDSDQGRPRDLGMSVEDRLAGDGEERLLGQDHPVRLPPAEPEPSLVVAIAQVSHAMKKRLPRGVGDLGQAGCLGSVEILSGHDRAGHDDLADLAVGHEQVVGPGGNRIVADLDDPGVDARDGPADAYAHSLVGGVAGFAQNLAAADRCDRQ